MAVISTNADPTVTPSELAEIGKIFIKNNFPLLVTGKPGQGKSAIIEQTCLNADVDLITDNLVTADPTDEKGMPAIVDGVDGEKSAVWIPFGTLLKLIHADRPTVHFADDLGHSSKMVQAAYMQIVHARKINDYKISKHVTFLAATNRKKDKAGVQSIITPLLDRYVTIVELINSMKDWVAWALKEDLAYEVISYVRYRPMVLDEFEPTPDMSQTPTPRGMHNISRMLKANMPQELQLRLFAGTIGKARATEFVGFLRIFQDLPDPDAVLMDPKNAKIPTKPGHLYALCGALSARATEHTIERLIEYAVRLETDQNAGKEFSILVVKDAVTKNENLCNTIAFTKWASNNQDVLV